MWCTTRNPFSLVALLLIPACIPFQIQQLPDFKNVIKNKVLHAVDIVEQKYNIAGTLGLSAPIIRPILRRQAVADLSHMANFFEGQSQLGDSVKSVMQLVVNPLLLASGTCNASSAPWPLTPPQNANSTYRDMLWEAKFTSKLGDHNSFHGAVGLDTSGNGVKGFGIEVQPDSLTPDYSIGMQWSFQRSIAGFTFAVSIASDELRSAGLADIHLLYSHPHWLCSSQCNAMAFSQSPSDPLSSPTLNESNVARFMESTVLQGFGVTFRKFNGSEFDMAHVFGQLPGNLAALQLRLADLQARLRSQTREDDDDDYGFSFGVGDVTTVWTNATHYQWVNSSYCPGCGDVLQKPFDVDPADGLAAIEGIMLTDSMKAQFTVGQPSNADLTAGLEGHASIGLISGCDTTHVLLDTPNASLGALVNSVKNSYSPGVTNRLLDAMGPAAQLAVQDASLNISVGPSAVEVVTIGIGLPWLPAGASQTNNLLVWLTSVAVSPKVNISMKAQFHTQLKLEFGMQSLADIDEPTVLQLAKHDGGGLDVRACIQTFEEGSQVSQDLLVAMPLIVCMANCSSPSEQKQLVYFIGSAQPMPSGLTGRLSSNVNWLQAFGYPFMQISAMYMQVEWPINMHRPTEAQWQGILCLGTTANCGTGQWPSITGNIFGGINVSSAEGNYLVGELPQFKIGTLMDVVIGHHISMQVASIIANASVLPQGPLSPEQCEFFEGKGFDGLSAGCFVSLTFPQFTDRNYLPDFIQLSGRLQLSTWLLSVTIGINNNVMTVEGPLPLWCLSIREVCEMKLGGMLNDCHAQGPSNLTMSLGQQGASLQINGAMEIPTLKGCGMVSVHLVDDYTFQSTGPFSLLNGSWITTAKVTWPVNMSSFLVQLGSIAFTENVPVLTDVRYYVDGNSPVSSDGSFSLQATWNLFSFTEPDTVIDFTDDKFQFNLQTKGLENAGALLANTIFDVFGVGQMVPSGNLEDAPLHLIMSWQVERELNVLINTSVVDLTSVMVDVLNTAKAQMTSMFQEVQTLFDTTLLPMRNTLAWGLQNITNFLSSEFGMALASYDGIYVKEPGNLFLSYNVSKGLTGEVNAYGCPVYVIYKLDCNQPNCKAHPTDPYVRSDCMVPKVSALNIVRGLRYAMVLRQAEIDITIRTNPSFVAIAQTLGLLTPSGNTVSLSTLIPHIPVTATVHLNPSHSKLGRSLQQDPCFSCIDYNTIHTKTGTPTETATRTFKKLGAELHVLESKFAAQETVPKLLGDVNFQLTYPLNITDSFSFGKSIQETSTSAASGITDLMAGDQQRWDGLEVLIQNYSAPHLDLAVNVVLPCTGGDMYGFPPVATFDPACARDAVVQVIKAVALPSPCAQTILKLKWQAFDNATCAGKSNIVEQIVTQAGPSQLRFATFPNNVTIINNMTLGLGVLGKPTSPPPECNLTSVISFKNSPAGRLPEPGTWVIDRIWTIAPFKVECINPNDEDAYKLSLTYSQVQRITIQDATPPVFTSTPSTPLTFKEGTQPVPSLTGTPVAVDPIDPDLLEKGVIRSNVSVTYSDVVTVLPNLVMNRQTGWIQYRRTWRAIDESGNYALFEQLIYVKISSK